MVSNVCGIYSAGGLEQIQWGGRRTRPFLPAGWLGPLVPSAPALGLDLGPWAPGCPALGLSLEFHAGFPGYVPCWLYFPASPRYRVYRLGAVQSPEHTGTQVPEGTVPCSVSQVEADCLKGLDFPGKQLGEGEEPVFPPHWSR